MKILVVDDDDLCRKVLLEVFVTAGFEVSEARDGDEALTALESDPSIGVILLDRMMPNVDGIEFMTRFSNRMAWQDKRVIMQTAANQPKHVIEGNATGVYYYLTKPFDDEIVLSIVRAAVSDIEAQPVLSSRVINR